MALIDTLTGNTASRLTPKGVVQLEMMEKSLTDDSGSVQVGKGATAARLTAEGPPRDRDLRAGGNDNNDPDEEQRKLSTFDQMLRPAAVGPLGRGL